VTQPADARARAAAGRRPTGGALARRSTISVALCTFDGARYLRQQLASILEQSRPPEQIVVCDDGSRDGSVELVRSVLQGAGIAFRVVVNPARLGPSGNYEQALRLCEHDIVAFSDQDDIWHADKLARLEAALLDDPGACAVFSDARAIDSAGHRLDFSQWQACWFGPRVRAAYGADLFPLLVRYPVVCGATLAIRRAAALRCLPIGAGWLHDEWLALTCAATSRLAFVEAELVDYRIHDAQSVGLVRPSWRARLDQAKKLDAAYFRAQIARFTLLAERLGQWTPPPAPAVQATLQRKLAFLRRRASIRAGEANPWLAATGQLLDGSHHRYGHGFGSWLLDAGYDLVYGRRAEGPGSQ
jgi:glycosyltransferase involved in cell wall biosynthesis